MLWTIALLAFAGTLVGVLSRSGEEFVAGQTGWNELPAPEDLLVSIALILGAYLVFRLAPRRLRWLGMGLSAAASLRYITWRATSTLNFSDPANATACTLLFAAELYTVGLLFLGHFQTFRPRRRTTPSVPEGAQWPSVDVFITTYDESVDVVRRTAVGCVEMRYPGEKKVWILDDGRRLEMQQLAASLGVGYLTRDDNAHAKAGNLNEAMKRTDGELIAQFDADHVPVRSFLEETVPFFLGQEDLALVQTPHHFQNPDVFQRNLLLGRRISNEQDLFFQVLQPGNDHWNAAFFCGSNAVLRRKAIEDVGGFATETITEDAHTALRMHARGWQSAYLNRILAGGVTAETFSDALTQRLRWGMGMIGILKTDNPLTCRGLSWAQRICYFAASFFFFFGIPRILFFLAPVSFLLLGVRPIDASILPVAAIFIPHILAGWLVTSGVSRNYRHTFWSEVYESSMAFYMAAATVWSAFTSRKLPFRVTPKEVRRSKLAWSLKPAIPTLVLLGLSLAALVQGVEQFRSSGVEESGVLAMNFVWLGYNVLLLAAGVLVTVDRPQQRRQPRLPVYLPATVHWRVAGREVSVRGVALDLSEGGVRALLRAAVPAEVPLEVELSDGERVLRLPARQTYTRPSRDAGAHGCALQFTAVDEEQRRQIIRWMYTDPDTWQNQPEPLAPLPAFLRFAGTAIRWSRTHERQLLRRSARFPRRFHGELQRCGEAGGPPRAADVLDLSEGGARVRLDRGRLRRGEDVRLSLTLPDRRTLTLEGTVGARRGAHEYALRFADLDAAAREELLWLLFVEPLHAEAGAVADQSGTASSRGGTGIHRLAT